MGLWEQINYLSYLGLDPIDFKSCKVSSLVLTISHLSAAPRGISLKSLNRSCSSLSNRARLSVLRSCLSHHEPVIDQQSECSLLIGQHYYRCRPGAPRGMSAPCPGSTSAPRTPSSAAACPHHQPSKILLNVLSRFWKCSVRL